MTSKEIIVKGAVTNPDLLQDLQLKAEELGVTGVLEPQKNGWLLIRCTGLSRDLNSFSEWSERTFNRYGFASVEKHVPFKAYYKFSLS